MKVATSLAPTGSVDPVCRALGVPRAGFYRHRAPAATAAATILPAKAVRGSPRALDSDERQAILDVLHSPRFQDRSPTEAYATLLDEGVYLGSERTYYRLLAAEGETTERRNQLTHPTYHKPELLAVRPNQVWSWDMTKLLGPTTWTYYCLYMILDIFSRGPKDSLCQVSFRHLLYSIAKVAGLGRISMSNDGRPRANEPVAIGSERG